jgi:hypothetical protein
VSNTERVHKRFWSAMAERYGRRWSDQYGPEASQAWRELINRFSPDDVKGALGMLKTEAPDHPPTQPQFETLLSKAAASRARIDRVDYLRGYWRSVVIDAVRSACRDRDPWPQDAVGFEAFVVEHRETLGASMRALLDELCDLERKTGQRTQGLLELAHQRAGQIVRTFRPIVQHEAAL